MEHIDTNTEVDQEPELAHPLERHVSTPQAGNVIWYRAKGHFFITRAKVSHVGEVVIGVHQETQSGGPHAGEWAKKVTWLERAAIEILEEGAS